MLSIYFCMLDTEEDKDKLTMVLASCTLGFDKLQILLNFAAIITLSTVNGLFFFLKYDL